MDEIPEDQKRSENKSFFRTSASGKVTVEKALETGQIELAQEVVKLAVAIALASGHRCAEDARLSGNGMNWGMSQFDPDGSLRKLVRSLYFVSAAVSDHEVYSVAELLADRGLELLADGLAEGRSVAQISTDFD